jgi:hypothetical protein
MKGSFPTFVVAASRCFCDSAGIWAAAHPATPIVKTAAMERATMFRMLSLVSPQKVRARATRLPALQKLVAVPSTVFRV